MGKVTKKIMNIGLLSIFCFVLSGTIYSQETYNLSGTFEGSHIEFTSDGSNDSLVYLYKFELVQDKQIVKGKSFIYNDDGYYAVVQLRGLIIDNQLYFEEFETIDEINPEKNHWCYTSGHLDIIRNDENTSLSGFTKSYTKQYGALCRIGYSELLRIDPILQKNEILNSQNNSVITGLTVKPNPTEAATSIEFELSTEKMTIIEVYDLEGELIIEVLRRNLMPGSYSIPIDLSFKDDGMYVIELIVDRKLYTTELWKSRF